jgi:thiamine biosynthesis protein ThiS
MQIIVNGEARSLAGDMTVQALLQTLDLGEGRIAVEHNGEIVPRSEFSSRQLGDGDKIEIVQAIGGG